MLQITSFQQFLLFFLFVYFSKQLIVMKAQKADVQVNTSFWDLYIHSAINLEGFTLSVM